MRIFISRGCEAITSPARPQQLILVFFTQATWEKPAEGGTQKAVLAFQTQRVEGGGGCCCLWRAAPAACVDLDRLISQFREKTKLTEQLEGGWSAFIIECS